MATRTKFETRERFLAAAEQLVFERGFTATTVDAVLAAAGGSKGSFFHHFPTKAALGQALIERYARADAEVLETYMARAEARTSDPAEQIIEFLRGFEEAIDDGTITQPGCLFASFVYEQIPEDAGSDTVILEAIGRWRERILDKLEQAAASRPMALPVDLASLADQVWTVFEGGFVLVRATEDHTKLRDQLSHLRHYLTLLFQL